MMATIQTLYQENRKSAKEYISSLKRNSFRKQVEEEVAYLLNTIEKYNVSSSPELLEYAGYEIEDLVKVRSKEKKPKGK